MSKVLVLVAVLAGWAEVAQAGSALDKPSFTATPAELQAIAKTAPAGDWPAVVLREDEQIDLDSGGKRVRHWHLVFAVRTQAGVDDWSKLTSAWRPFYQEQPVVRARVVEPDGTVVALDPGAVSDAPAVSESASVFSDLRRLEAPLPRVQIGAIVEEEIAVTDRNALLGAYGASVFYVGNGVPTLGSHVVMSAPTAIKARIATRGLDAKVKPRHAVAGGRETWTWDLGLQSASDDQEISIPGDVVRHPAIGISNAPSWGALASAYRRVVDQRIADGALALPPPLPRTPTIETVRAIVAWLHAQVRYTGIEYGEASNVPWPPAETVKRGYGDCKDKATLLVALLRQAGIRADLALLSDGPGQDTDPQLPALAGFDHAIVRARIGAQDVWIDATEDAYPAGLLPPRDEDRRALVIADDTRDLVVTPRVPGGSTLREIRTWDVPENGAAKVTVIERTTGAYAAENREYFRDARGEEIRKWLVGRVNKDLGSKAFDHYATSAVGDVDAPFELTVVAGEAKRAVAGHERFDIYLYPADTVARVPSSLTTKPDDGAPARAHDFEWWIPQHYEIENRIVLPPAFLPPEPQPKQTRALGTATFSEERKVDGQTLVVTLAFDSGKQRLTAKELTDLRTALTALHDETIHIVAVNRVQAARDAKDPKHAAAEAQKLIALHPKEALHHGELATVYVNTGSVEAARREAELGVKLEPRSADAFATLGWVLSVDSIGRQYGGGWPRAQAIAALRNAVALDPKNYTARFELASALEHGPAGGFAWTPADLSAAVTAWQALYEQWPDEPDAIDGIALALLRAGRAGEAEAIARKGKRETLIVASVAARDPAAGIALARSLRTGAELSKMLSEAGRILLRVRTYAPIIALLKEAGVVRDGSLDQRVFGGVVRHDEKLVASADPVRATQIYIANMFDPNIGVDEIDEDMQAELLAAIKRLKGGFAAIRKLDPAVVRDLMLSGMSCTTSGKGPWRVECSMFGQRSQLYVALRGNIAKVFADTTTLIGVGRYALERIAAKDVPAARAVMSWAAADAVGTVPAATLRKMWGGTIPDDDAGLTVAASAIARSPDPAAISALTACKTAAPDAKEVCDRELGFSLGKARKYKDLETRMLEWEKRDPKSKPAALFHVSALLSLKQRASADAEIAARAAAEPTEHLWKWLAAISAEAYGTTDEAINRYEALTTDPAAAALDLRRFAWFLAAVRREPAKAVELATAASRLDANDAEIVIARGAAECEAGDLEAARADVVHSIEMNQHPHPAGKELYVLGRIDEQLGLTADAVALYRKIKAPPNDDSTFPDSPVLAAQRLKALGAVK